MDKDAYRELFIEIVAKAIQEAKTASNKDIPSDFVVEMYGAGHSGKLMGINEAMDLMYISDSKFYATIDVGVKSIDENQTTMFVRISPQEPCSFEMTWNSPKGCGPFKVIVPLKL